MIEAVELSKYFQSTPSLEGVNLSIAQGEKVAILGPNGAGKTTLMRLMLGLYAPTSGQLRIHGFDPFKERSQSVAHISFVPQLSPPIRLSVDALCGYARQTAQTDEGKVAAITERMGMDLESVRHKAFYTLSGGMRQKLMIALAFARSSKMILLDEPSSNIDPASRRVLLELLEALDETQTVVMISHRLEELSGIIRRSVTMDLGRIVDDRAL
ncbi:MAG: ABC transporter ATP-binding protein [Campylobacterales bacterium]|nr:ABC transporter ATP-binding protein [Campylobacterales bacterium]